MEIKSFRLKHVGRFDDLDMALAPTDKHSSNVTVLVGNNGAGKTTLLKSLAISLSWLVARIRSEKGNGSPIAEESIQNGFSSASISIVVTDAKARLDESIEGADSGLFGWMIARSRQGRKTDIHSSLMDAGRFGGHLPG